MTYLGRQQLGTYLDVYFQSRLAGVATLPDAVPSVRIYSASSLVYSKKMPIIDKSYSPGLFRSQVFLGTGFDVGQHTVHIGYAIAGNPKVEIRNFEIVPGGNVLGQVLGMTYVHYPQADFIVYQTESGLILRGKNARKI